MRLKFGLDIEYIKEIKMSKKFIQKIKKGGLHHSLGIPLNERIPKALLQEIKAAKPGDEIDNKGIGKDRIKITEKLKRQAQLAINLEEFRR